MSCRRKASMPWRKSSTFSCDIPAQYLATGAMGVTTSQAAALRDPHEVVVVRRKVTRRLGAAAVGDPAQETRVCVDAPAEEIALQAESPDDLPVVMLEPAVDDRLVVGLRDGKDAVELAAVVDLHVEARRRRR